jgi:hypothetical protein
MSVACLVAAAGVGTGQTGCSSPTASPAGALSEIGTTAAAAKGSDAGSDASSDSGQGATGAASISASWTLPGAEQFDSLSWVLTPLLTSNTGDGGSGVQSGTVPVSGSSVVFLIGGLKPGAYTIEVSGTSTDGATTCANSAALMIKPNQTTAVSIALTCMSAFPDAGYVQVNGSTFNCPTLTFVSVIPAEVTVGNSVTVSASATGPDPTAVTYSWSAPSGTFSAPTSAVTSFTCTAAGLVPITLQIGDGAVPDGSACDPASSTAAVSVQCD